jgi:hypothetical protein
VTDGDEIKARGDFNLNLRAYLPKPELLNNSYIPPVVQRVK